MLLDMASQTCLNALLMLEARTKRLMARLEGKWPGKLRGFCDCTLVAMTIDYDQEVTTWARETMGELRFKSLTFSLVASLQWVRALPEWSLQILISQQHVWNSRC